MKQKLTEEGLAMIEKIKARNIKYNSTKAGFDPVIQMMYRTNINCLPDFGEYQKEFETRFVFYNEIDGNATYYTQSSPDYERVVIYLHGGAYIFGPMTEHFSFCADMAKRLNARVYFPLYPSAPKVTYPECYDFMDRLYAQICADAVHRSIIFMGDSAGGGLALAYAQDLAQRGFEKLPAARALISPWVEVSMANQKAMERASQDIFLDRYALGITGQMWAGDGLCTDPRVSPYYGSLDDGIPTLFIAGEHEILLPDIRRTYLKLRRNGCDATMIVGEGMFHVYPVYDFDMGFDVRREIEKLVDRI